MGCCNGLAQIRGDMASRRQLLKVQCSDYRPEAVSRTGISGSWFGNRCAQQCTIGTSIGCLYAMLAFALFTVVVGCDDPGALEIEEGSRCGDMRDHCADDHTLLSCVDRVWEAVPCSEICSVDHAVALGCLDRDDGDVCECEWPTCGSRGSTCLSFDEMGACVEGIWELVSCEQTCATQEPSLASAGCRFGIDGAECSCTAEGAPCPVEGERMCDGQVTLAVCENGAWAISECAGSCETGRRTVCLPWGSEQTQEASCGCD